MAAFDILDLSSATAQRTFIDSRPDPPSPTSTLFIKRFSTAHNDGTTSETVVGVHIVLARRNPNGLWEALNVDRATQRIDAGKPKVAIRSLAFCCDTLEIHGEFSVPEAAIDVFARRVVWADETASVNTSPLDWTIGKARNAAGTSPGEHGAEGRPAGAIRVFAHEVTPATHPRPRLVAAGGRGQDPGAGQDGQAGEYMPSYSSYQFSITDSGISTSRRTLSFSPPAVYIQYEWRWAASRVWGPGSLGADRFPRPATPALAPGRSGSGGHGGAITTNAAALAAASRNPAGAAGTRERNYVGGAAAQPTVCAKYSVQLWENIFGTDSASYEMKQTAKQTNARGADGPSQPSLHGDGTTTAPVLSSIPNAWLHPLGLQATLEFARDLFLAGGRDQLEPLLAAYRDALAQPLPKTGAWDGVPPSQWTAAQTEVATMLQRLAAHLDYFGNPAGYTPLLSLPGAIKLYENETRRALRLLLLTRWVEGADHDVREAAAALTEALTAANEDSRQASEAVTAAEATISEVQGLIDSLERELDDLGHRLTDLRNALLVKAMNDLERKAAIKFGIKLAGAVCQIIPVGQPALGTIGSLGAVAAEFVDGDEDAAPDTLSKMGEVLKSAAAAAKEAKDASDEAKSEKDADAPKDKSEAKARSSRWATVGQGLGPAMSILSDGVKALQAPKSEIDAALARLESQDPAWNDLTRDIRALNEKKVALFSNLADAVQEVGEGFSRLASNASAIVSLQQQREKASGTIDPDAVFAVRQFGQRSRLTLQKYLYLMVKAYESTLLKPLAVDWNLTAVTDKINTLIQPKAGFDAAGLNAQADALDVLFQQNLATIRGKLLDEFDMRERTTTLKLGLSATQTPEILQTLNSKGEVVIDPEAHGLILPTEHLSRLSGVTLTRLTFDPAKPKLPDANNAVIALVPARSGTMRRGEALCLVSSDAPVRWGWTYLSATDIRAATPSATAKDVLDFILGSGSTAVRQKVAQPPAWSDLQLSVLFSPPLPEGQRPVIADLYFEIQIDSSPAPAFQRVLSVRPAGTPAGAVTTCSPDLAQRANGLDRLVRIYTQGDAVQLSVPDHAGGSAFEGWDVIGSTSVARNPETRTLTLKMSDHALAISHWTRTVERTGPPVVLARVIDHETLREIAARHQDRMVRDALAPVAAAAMVALPPVATARALRIAPDAAAAVVGVVPADGTPDDLGDVRGAWRLVNYQGVVGWLQA
jgi:hypothetical protein